MSLVKVSLDLIGSKSSEALVKHGAAPWIAAEVAKAIRKAESVKNLICGLYYLESYCQQLVTRKVKGTVEPEIQQLRTASLKVDAKFGFAQPAFARGLDQAITMAKQAGTCAYAVCHAHTCTSLGYFTEQIAQRGLIAIGFTNASAIVSPPGGNKRLLGTNPMAMSVPAKDGGLAFQFDQSTSAVALGKITMAAASGESIPLGWAVDAAGKPTTDPHEAIKGSLVSTGGYKGFGFGLMVEILASALTGSVSSMDIQGLKMPEGAPHNLGQFYFLVDPETFAGSVFWERLSNLEQAIAEQPGARLPGTRKPATTHVEIEQNIWDLTLSLTS